MRNDDSVIKNACCKQVAFRAADLLSSYVYGYIDSRNTTVFRFDENLFYCMAKRGVPELIAQAITEYNEYMWSTHEDEDFYQWLKDYEKYAKNKVFLHSMIKNAESYCEHDYDNRKTLYDPDGFEIYEKDILERHIRIPRLKSLYEQKVMKLDAFQQGRNIWKE